MAYIYVIAVFVVGIWAAIFSRYAPPYKKVKVGKALACFGAFCAILAACALALGEKHYYFAFLLIIPALYYVIWRALKRKKTTLSNVEYASVSEALAIIDNMEGHEFEYWCADLLKQFGYSEVSVTKGSGDQGVDILATKNGKKYAIQCKRYESKLSNTPVQEVIAGKSFYDCDVAVVMTNNYFTDGAIALAHKIGVELWDRDTIVKMLSLYQKSRRSQDTKPTKSTALSVNFLQNSSEKKRLHDKGKTTEAHGVIDEIELYSAATDDD